MFSVNTTSNLKHKSKIISRANQMNSIKSPPDNNVSVDQLLPLPGNTANKQSNGRNSAFVPF